MFPLAKLIFTNLFRVFFSRFQGKKRCFEHAHIQVILHRLFTLLPFSEINFLEPTTGGPEVVGSIPTEVKRKFFFTSCGSLIPFTRANAQWVFHGFLIAL